MFDIFELIKEALKNNGLIKIENKGNDNKSIMSEIESYFYENEFLISGISYTKSDEEAYKRKKAVSELKRIISHSDENFYYVNMYEVFNINIEDRNEETLKTFNDFFLIMKKAHLSKYHINIDLGLERTPYRLVATIMTKYMDENNDYIQNLQDLLNKELKENIHIKKWASETAKRIKVVSPYIGIAIEKTTVLNITEEIEKIKIIIELRDKNKIKTTSIKKDIPVRTPEILELPDDEDEIDF